MDTKLSDTWLYFIFSTKFLNIKTNKRSADEDGCGGALVYLDCPPRSCSLWGERWDRRRSRTSSSPPGRTVYTTTAGLCPVKYGVSQKRRLKKKPPNKGAKYLKRPYCVYYNCCVVSWRNRVYLNKGAWKKVHVIKALSIWKGRIVYTTTAGLCPEEMGCVSKRALKKAHPVKALNNRKSRTKYTKTAGLCPKKYGVSQKKGA